MQRKVGVLTIAVVAAIIVLASLIFLIVRMPLNGSNNSSATAQQRTIKATTTAQTQFSRLDTNPQRLTLTNVDYNGLLNNAQTAVDAVKQQIRSQIPQGQNVGLAIAYDGTPDVNGITVADTVTEKVYGVLRQLGQEGFAFNNASYYDKSPLFTLGTEPSVVKIDIFFLVQ